ncbi:MAG: VanZ family protein [Eubacterium sp.]
MKEYIIRAIIITIIASPIYLIVRRPWRFKDKREITLGVFVIYLLCLFVFTLEGTYANPADMFNSALERLGTGENINIIPFRTISGFFKNSTADAFWINIVSNVVIFIPWGFLLPCLWEKFRTPKTLLPMCLGITVFIEIYQLFIWRNTDVDDIILNFFGGALGGLVFFFFQKFNAKRKI